MAQTGENIRTLRQKHGMTQEALAAVVGVSAQAVSKWETGDSLPDTALLCPIADALGVSLDVLMGREVRYADDVYSSLIRIMRGVPESELPEKLREAAWQLQKSWFNHYWPGYDFAPDDVHAHNRSSSICDDYGFTIISNRPALPFFCLFDEPKDGFGSVLKYDEAYRIRFEALADADTLKAFFYLYSVSPDFIFEGEVLCDRCNIAEDKLAGVLGRLANIGCVKEHDISVDGETKRLYYIGQHYIYTAIFALLNELIYASDSFDLQACHRNKPMISAGNGSCREGEGSTTMYTP